MLTVEELDTLKGVSLSCLFDAQKVVSFSPLSITPPDPDSAQGLRGMLDSLDARVYRWGKTLAKCEEVAEVLSLAGKQESVRVGVDVYPTAFEAAWRFAKAVSDIGFAVDLSIAATPMEWASDVVARVRALPSAQHIEAAIIREHGDARRLADPIYKNPGWFNLTHKIDDSKLRSAFHRAGGKIRRIGSGKSFQYSARDLHRERPDLVDKLPM